MTSTGSSRRPSNGGRVAVATDGSSVAPHFGRCDSYTLADIVDGEIKTTQIVPNPGHEPGRLPKMLAALGVSCVLAGGMGMRAEALFAEAGISAISGVQGPVSEILRDFAAGKLAAGQSLCEHEQGGPGHRAGPAGDDET